MPESPDSTKILRELIAYTDGASRGNPGPASYGVVIQDETGSTIDTISEKIGMATNNVAEYSALIAALEYATRVECKKLRIRCDSELMAKQMQGRYRVQSPDLKPLYERAKGMADKIPSFIIQYIPREQNREADRLANLALDKAPPSATVRPPVDQTTKETQATPIQSFTAIFEGGTLRPLAPAPSLQEGAQYVVQVRRR